MANNTPHIIEYFGQSPGTRNCGYCKESGDSDFTFGMWAHSLSPQAYQLLIDRNWRRSGKYCYKPINESICCPMYTIRCDALNFKLKKSHKKAIKNFNNFIKFGSRPSKAIKDNSSKSAGMDEFKDCLDKAQKTVGDFEVPPPSDINASVPNSDSVVKSTSEQSEKDNLARTSNIKNVNITEQSKKLKVNKKKFMRRQKLIQKLMKRQNCSEIEAKQILFERSCRKQKTKSLEDFLSEFNNSSEPKHVFQKKIIPLTSSNTSSFETSYKVFYEYQKNIHKEGDEKISFRGFKQFLVDSPIKYEANNIEPQRDTELVRYYGSFHQHYYIDDRLVAVAVLDILPNCISSVYLFYDPEYHFLNLGVYSALNEIALVRKYSKFLPDLRYYYMGFYIHSCPKMIYKGQFLPSDLLCSETYRWFTIESCTSKLTGKRYSRFCDDAQVKDDDGKVDDKDIWLWCPEHGVTRDKSINLATFRSKHSLNRSTLNSIHEFGSLVGKRCAPHLRYYVS